MITNIQTKASKIGVVLSVLSLTISGLHAQQWENVGSAATVSADDSSFNNLVIDNAGNYYISYYDLSVSKGSVQKFNGTSWSYLGGNAGISGDYATYNSLSLAPNGNLYYTNQASGFEAMEFNGTSWNVLPAISSSTTNYQASAVSSNNTLFTYGSYGSGTVKRYVNGAWEQVGNAGFSSGAMYAEMVIGSNNMIYTANVSSGLRVYQNSVSASSSDAWSLVGGNTVDAASASEQYNSDIAIDGSNNLYVAYVSNSAGGQKLNVKKFNGTSWVQIGAANFSNGRVQHVALAVTPAGVPYVVASRWENDDLLKNTAYTFNTTTNAWETLGGVFISDGEATYNDLAYDAVSNSLVLTYSQDGVKVKKYALTGSTTPPVTPPVTPPSAACTIVPVSVSGFNADVVAEGNGDTADKTTHTVDAFYTFYSKDFVPTNPHSSGASANAYGGGLPTNGTLTSTAISGLNFQMANYSGNNALVLRNNVSNTGSLTFATPKKAQKIYVAAVRGEGGSGTADNHNVTAIIHFADGTTQNAVFQATAWWNDSGAPSNVVVSGTGEVSRNTATSGWAPRNEFRGLTQASVFYNELTVDAANINKQITSIDFNKATTSNASHTTAILALSICETPNSTACTNTDPGTTAGDTGCITFTYKGQTVTYTTVRGADGNIWLQQNLGSSQVATSLNDAASYGDLFQWGRWDDGHQTRNSATTNEPTPNNPSGLNNSSSFILGSWWGGNALTDQWTATANAATAVNGTDPCLVLGQGWKMPTQAEWTTVKNTETINDPSSAFASKLKLPANGNRSFTDGGFVYVGERGYYWSSTTTGLGAKYFYVGATIANPGAGSPRGQGSAVRCMKPASSLSVSDVSKISFGIYPNPTNGILNIKTDSQITQASVTNLVGQRMPVELRNNQIDMTSFAKGIYVIEVQFKNGQKVSKKIIKN